MHAAIKRKFYVVEYLDRDDTIRDYEVRVTGGDITEAEFLAPKFGIVDAAEQPHNVGALWLFLASRRAGLIPDDCDFPEFRTRCLDNAKLSDEPVPPTREDHGSPSSSPVLSPASPTTDGSTP